MFTTYGCGRHLVHVTKPRCIFFQSLLPESFTWYLVSVLIFWYLFEKTKFKFENGVTFVEGQIKTLTFDTNVASLNNLVQCSYQL